MEHEIIDLSTDSDDDTVLEVSSKVERKPTFDQKRYDSYMTEYNFIIGEKTAEYTQLIEIKRLLRKLRAEQESIANKTAEDWKIIKKVRADINLCPKKATEMIVRWFKIFEEREISPSRDADLPTFSVKDAYDIIEKMNKMIQKTLEKARTIDDETLKKMTTDEAENEYKNWDKRMTEECDEFLHCEISHVCYKYADLKLCTLLDAAAGDLLKIQMEREESTKSNDKKAEIAPLKRERDDEEEHNIPEVPRRSMRDVPRVFYGNKKAKKS